MLRKFLALALLVVAFCFTSPAVAGPSYGRCALDMSWCRKAAEQGNADAQAHLGYMYEHGLGVPQDYAQALSWYRKAVEQGNADAQFNLGLMYTNGEGVPQDYVQAVSWYRKAAEQGKVYAQAHLGLMYAHGLGVPQDYVQAHMWINLAASRQTDPEGRSAMVKARDDLAAKMTREQIARAQQLARDWKPKGR